MYKRILLAVLFFFSLMFQTVAADMANFTSPLKSVDIENRSLKASLHNLLTNFGYVGIPIFKKGSLFYVNGKVANQPVFLLLDTGSVTASILSDGVEKLKLSPEQTDEKTANSTGGIKLARKVRIPALSIGNLQLGEISANIMDQPFKYNLPTIVIGNDFFIKYNAVLDIKDGFLYLNPKPIPTRDQNQLKRLLEGYHYQNIPLTKLSYGHYILPIQINNALPVYFLFDTGTSVTTISIPYVNHLKIQPIDQYKTQAATDGTITFADINLQKIIFNPLKTFFAKPVELVNRNVTSANIESLSAFLEVVGIIGLADMEKLNAIIDIPSQSVFLKVDKHDAA